MSLNLLQDCPPFALIGGFVTPGTLDENDPFPGLKDPRKWDERKGYGLGGATSVFAGKSLAKFSIRGRLWADEHWPIYEEFVAVVYPVPNTANPKALDLVHPIPNDLRIRAVNVVAPVGLKQTSPGVWTWEVEVEEYRAPQPQLANPKGASSGGTQKAKDPKDAEIDALAAQIKSEGEALDKNLRRIGV